MALRRLGAALLRLSLITTPEEGSKLVAPVHGTRSQLAMSKSTTSSFSSQSLVSSRLTSLPTSLIFPTRQNITSVSALQVKTLNCSGGGGGGGGVCGERRLWTSGVAHASLRQMHRTGPIKKKRPNKNPLVDKPFAKGVVLKTLVKNPRKPNSANRKCVLLRLSTGREMVAYVPGEGHNLQEHNIVLVRPGRLQDVPGVKLKCVRGKYDLGHVIKRKA